MSQNQSVMPYSEHTTPPESGRANVISAVNNYAQQNSAGAKPPSAMTAFTQKVMPEVLIVATSALALLALTQVRAMPSQEAYAARAVTKVFNHLTADSQVPTPELRAAENHKNTETVPQQTTITFEDQTPVTLSF